MLAEVRLDLQVWSLDRPLTYLVPEKLSGKATVGSIVRVPLRGRKVRGWITAMRDQPMADGTGSDLQEISTVSGAGPVFDGPLLTMAEGLARFYVHPVSSFLSLLTPPRLGRASAPFPDADTGGREGRVLHRLGAGEDPAGLYIDAIREGLDEGLGAIVAVPEVREGSRIIHRISAAFPTRSAVVHSGQDPAERSSALWAVARGERDVVLGGRAALFAPPMRLGLIVIHQEHDRSFKEQRSPYYDAREVAIRRAEVVGSDVLLASATPALSTMYRKDLMVHEPSRPAERSAWPAVELLEPKKQAMPRRAIAAIIDAYRNNERSIILLPRVSNTPSGPGPQRLADFIARVVPGAKVARADRPGMGDEPGALAAALNADVIVATEAALADVEHPRISTAVALSIEAFLKKPQGRVAEETFQTLWTLGGIVAGRSPRGRLLLETSRPEHYLVQALTRGDYHYFVRHELAERQAGGNPPAVRLVRLQVADGSVDPALTEALTGLPDTRILGPVPGGVGSEILLKTTDLSLVTDRLGTIVRQTPQRVLVEVDPREW